MREIRNETVIRESKTFKDIENARRNIVSEEDSKQDEEPCSFEDIFGDLSNTCFIGHLNLSGLNLNSLKGCPQKISQGSFQCHSNWNLDSLNHFPKELTPNQNVLFCFTSVNSVKNINPEIFKDTSELNMLSTYLTIFETVYISSSMRKTLGNFSKIETDYNSEDLERFYQIFEKVNFNLENFTKCAVLLDIPHQKLPF